MNKNQWVFYEMKNDTTETENALPINSLLRSNKLYHLDERDIPLNCVFSVVTGKFNHEAN